MNSTSVPPVASHGARADALGRLLRWGRSISDALPALGWVGAKEDLPPASPRWVGMSPHQRNAVLRRRAANKVARRSRRINWRSA